MRCNNMVISMSCILKYSSWNSLNSCCSLGRLVGEHLGAGFRGSWKIRNQGTNSHWAKSILHVIQSTRKSFLAKTIDRIHLLVLNEGRWYGRYLQATARWCRFHLMADFWGDGRFHLWPAMDSWASASAPPEEPTPQVFQVAEALSS